VSAPLNIVGFYSDPHFGHRNIIRYSNRPFESVEHMGLELISRYRTWWHQLPHQERLDASVVWCGDAFLCHVEEARAVMNQLPGRKILVRGNHDKWTAKKYHEIGFSLVVPELSVDLLGCPAMVRHHPPANHEIVHRYRGVCFVHGHTHRKLPNASGDGRCIDVGVDAWGFSPVSVENVRGLFYTAGGARG
jgi:calcineurin-like phosphoesterase family protein